MRFIIPAVAGFIGCVFSSVAVANPASPHPFPTGLTALDQFEKVAKLAPGEEVLGIVGFYGDPQPAQWLILTADPATPGVLRESVFARGKILAERRFRMLIDQDLPEIPFQRDAIKVDSDEALKVVQSVAREEQRAFATAHYQLRIRNGSHEPIWMISLLNRAQVPLGTLYVSAKTGEIVRRAWIKTPGMLEDSISYRE